MKERKKERKKDSLEDSILLNLCARNHLHFLSPSIQDFEGWFKHLFTSARKPFGYRSFESQRISRFSEFSIRMLDRINAVLNITRNIITSLSGSKSKCTHSNTTSPCTKHCMSILITSQSACNKRVFTLSPEKVNKLVISLTVKHQNSHLPVMPKGLPLLGHGEDHLC